MAPMLNNNAGRLVTIACCAMRDHGKRPDMRGATRAN